MLLQHGGQSRARTVVFFIQDVAPTTVSTTMDPPPYLAPPLRASRLLFACHLPPPAREHSLVDLQWHSFGDTVRTHKLALAGEVRCEVYEALQDHVCRSIRSVECH